MGKKTFFRIRVGILLAILFGVLLYAVRDIRSRRARKDWDHTLDVAVVILREGKVDPVAIEGLRVRAPVLADRLTAEMKRHRPGAATPVSFHVLGPIDGAGPAPQPASDGTIDLAKHAANLSRWLGAIDPRAGVVPEHYDTRIYVTVRPSTTSVKSMVEGQSEENGRIGLVSVDLDATMIDTTLFVVAHELMHTLGATDRYTMNGSALAEPERVPLFPQRFAEVMARNRVLAPGKEAVPSAIDELMVGAETAREIGWTP